LIRLFIWIYNILKWIVRWRLLFLALLPLLAGGLLLVLHANEQAWRWTGLFVQLLGIVTVLFGIRRTRIFFGQPGLLARARLLFSQFPRFRPRHIVMIVEAAQARATGSATGFVVNPPKSMLLEDRVEALESKLTAMKEQMEKSSVATEDKFSKMHDEITRGEELHAEEYKRLDEKVKKTLTGDLWLAQIGAVWLFFGVALSSMSIELSRWL
jgi:hypothetical protein